MIRDEIQHVALGMSVNYEGIFNEKDLIAFIDNFFRKTGYKKLVIGHSENVTPEGRKVSMRLRPFRQVKSKKLEVQLWLTISDIKTVIKEVDGLKIKLNKGKVKAVIDCFVISEERGGWEARAEYTAIRTIFDKFLFSGKSKDFEGMVKGDATNLRDELQSFLNLNKFLF